MAGSTLKSFGLRYRIVLILLAALAFGSYYILENLIDSQRTNAADINIAGRQRMLSQRIGFLFSQLENAKSVEFRKTLSQLLVQAIETMEKSHNRLIRNIGEPRLEGEISSSIMSYYFGPRAFLDRDVTAYLERARSYLQAIATHQEVAFHRSVYQGFNAEVLLDELNHVVNQYQVEHEEKVARLSAYQKASLGASLTMLLLSWLAVFRPMVIKINEFMSTIFKQDRSIKEIEERFLSISDSASMAMIVAVDMKGHVVFWNAAAERTFGYSRKEMAEERLTSIIPERYREAHAQGFERACQSPSSDGLENLGKTLELVGRHKDGHEFPIELSLGVWKQEGEKYFSAVIHDISKRKAEEKALIKAKEEAEAANKTKTDFLANMSHELRTPLNGILGFSQMMMDEVFGGLGHPKNKTYVEDINHAGEHLLRLVNEILDVSKIEAGKLSLSESPVDISVVLDGCAKIFTTQATQRGLALNIEVAEKLPMLRADEIRIEQICNNLISNAIKFTPAGGLVEVTVALSEQGDIVAKIMDTGIGIKEADIPKILQPFEQVENILTRSHEGSGLGLPLAKHLTEMQGGSLVIDSTVNQGTLVTVTFPRTKLVV